MNLLKSLSSPRYLAPSTTLTIRVSPNCERKKKERDMQKGKESQMEMNFDKFPVYFAADRFEAVHN